MKRMKDRPSPIYEIYDYIGDGALTRLKIPGFIKKHGTTPYEINLYIPSLLLPGQYLDAAIIAKLTLAPCYAIGRSDLTGSVTNPVYCGCMTITPGNLLDVNGFVDANDDLLLDLNATNLITGESIDTEYHQTFFQGLHDHAGVIIMYSLNEISPSIRKIEDPYR